MSLVRIPENMFIFILRLFLIGIWFSVYPKIQSMQESGSVTKKFVVRYKRYKNDFQRSVVCQVTQSTFMLFCME